MKSVWKPERLFSELEEVAVKLFPEVRREQGQFRTGVCELYGKTILFLNSRQPLDERIAALARAIAECNANEIYLKPAVRAEIEHHATQADAATQS